MSRRFMKHCWMVQSRAPRWTCLVRSRHLLTIRLLKLDQVIATPHLGASTKEAQEGVAFTVAEQMRDFLLTGALRGAVNVPAIGMKEFNLLQPYVVLAESLGRFQAQLVDKAVSEVGIEYAGDVVDVDAAPVTRAFLAGLLRDVSARVNVVNAFLIADERGIKVTTTYIRSGGELAPAMRTEIRPATPLKASPERSSDTADSSARAA